MELTENQRKVMENKYLRGDDPEKWLRGVAHNVALAELLYDERIKEEEIFKEVNYRKENGRRLLHHGLAGHDQRLDNFGKFIDNLERLVEKNETAREIVSEWEDKFYAELSNFRFLPNSPTLMNAGRELQQLSACFVLGVEDSMESWGNAVADTLLVHQSGGGTGYDFSRIRPKGDVVRKSSGVASGPLSPMRMIDRATAEVKQGGTRRGANMGILRVDHPDIRDFIGAKATGDLENFNISVALTDKFMEAYEKEENYALINPRNRKIVREENAREMFDLIVENAHRTGDPGIVFIDRVNRDNPTPNVGDIISTNPCITGDSLISTEFGLMRMDEIVKEFSDVGLSVIVDGRTKQTSSNGLVTEQIGVMVGEARKAWKSGLKETLRLKTESGFKLSATPNHKILTLSGWKELRELK